MANEAIMNAIYEEANKYGFGMSVEEMASKIYLALIAEGYDACIVNDRYISCNGCNNQLLKTRSKGCWTVKAF